MYCVEQVDETNYMHAIYGEPWAAENFSSISDNGDYDGCTLYVAPTPEEPAPEEPTPDAGV